MRDRVLAKSTLYGLLLAVTSMCLTAVALEVMLRIYHGALVNFESITHGRTPNAIADYDARLGWANGVQVLDLASEMLQMPGERLARMFDGKGHYGSDMNGWVAARRAEFLRTKGAAVARTK